MTRRYISIENISSLSWLYYELTQIGCHVIFTANVSLSIKIKRQICRKCLNFLGFASWYINKLEIQEINNHVQLVTYQVPTIDFENYFFQSLFTTWRIILYIWYIVWNNTLCGYLKVFFLLKSFKIVIISNNDKVRRQK